jgi:hypothetical protein
MHEFYTGEIRLQYKEPSWGAECREYLYKYLHVVGEEFQEFTFIIGVERRDRPTVTKFGYYLSTDSGILYVIECSTINITGIYLTNKEAVDRVCNYFERAWQFDLRKILAPYLLLYNL